MGGPDLVLDGSASREVDTILTESGIDRPSLLLETFTIANSISGPGGMTLLAEGSMAVQGAMTGDLLTLHRVNWINASNTAEAFLDYDRVGLLTGGGIGDSLHTHSHSGRRA